MKKTATYLGPAPGEWKCDVRLYRMDPPLDGHDHVFVSAVRLSSLSPEDSSFVALVDALSGTEQSPTETLIFLWDAETETVKDWGDLPGSIRGTLRHADALHAAGYDVATTFLEVTIERKRG